MQVEHNYFIIYSTALLNFISHKSYWQVNFTKSEPISKTMFYHSCVHVIYCVFAHIVFGLNKAVASAEFDDL